MPKYYVRCINERAIVSAFDELDACVLAMDKLGVATVGVCWTVSERGFEKHDDDVIIKDYYIINEILRRNKET